LVVADNLGVFADQAYAQPAQFSGPRLAFATLCFAFQIYGDFSAYSDIARGTAQLFGITIMRNFAYPYFSQSVAEFWRRWHISLSSWFRDYLFVPMGGSRVSRPRQVFNIMTTFILSGLWHGASWTYVAWGAFNGVGILPAVGGTKKRLTPMEIPGGEGLIPNAGTAIRMARTFLFICVAWVFFRATSFRDAFLVLERVFTAPFVGHASKSFTTFLTAKVALLLIGLFVGVEWICRDQVHPLRLARLPRFFRWSVYTLMIWLALYLRPMRMANFIYFQF
jgi:D-alanyl-lipoteichoic acid acyltransferase DltB (MBOAT superfamily)